MKMFRYINLVLLLMALFLSPLLLSGQDIKFNPSEYSGSTLSTIEQVQLGDNSPYNVALNIVNDVSSFLGLIFVILIIYAGFLWMTARGNEEQIEKAKTILKRSLIGLAIVLMSVSIAYLIYWLIVNSTVQADYTSL